MENLTGKRFGRLKVIELKEIKGKGHFYYLCQCQCGNFRTIDGHSLIKGKTKSCGCLRKELLRERNKTHNLSNSRLYGIYRHIKERCYNPNCKDYKYYGSCGIVMCEEWATNFMNFYNWAMANGYQDDLTIDRIDVNGNYEPNNCRWATKKEQSINRRNIHLITFNDKTQTLTDWAKDLNINFNTLYQRIITNKWDTEKAFMKPIRRQKTSNQRNGVGVWVKSITLY